jgi:tape measure domain-containing protein
MSSIDQRVVQMQFDNAQFERGVATTLGSLDKLNKSLQLQGATKGLSDVGAAANSVPLKDLAANADEAGRHFNAMSIIGATAIATITNKVVNAGIELTKAFTVDPVRDGFQNYETQINAVQTILANTAAEGTKIGDVNKALAELNTYANQTVYNFSDMTKNIGTFTAAGVNLKTSVESIKGIANLAAMSGSTSEQASTAMYQLSQAIASGTVKLQDWNSVVNAGLGGKTFQTALENTARASGVHIDALIKQAGGFRNSLQQGWLTSDVLTKTLSQFTGDLTAAQIKAMGFTAAQAKQIQSLGTTAVNAATQIKTATQLSQALKEEVATAYGAVFKTIFGDITQATDLFSKIHNVAENALTGPIYALNNLLQGWAKLGGRTALIDGITKAFQLLGAVMKPIEAAFREIFPPASAKALYDMTVTFRDFIERLKIGGTTADEIKRTFAGVFAVFKLGVDLIELVAKGFLGLFGIIAEHSGGILPVTANVGDFLVKLQKAIEKGDIFVKFFDRLKEVLPVPMLMIRALGQYIEALLGKLDFSKVTNTLDQVSVRLGPIGKLGQLADEVWTKFFNHFGDIVSFFAPAAKQVESTLSTMFHSIANGLSGISFDQILATINVGLFGGLIVLVRNFVKKFKGGGVGGELGGFVDTIKETFESLTKTLETMQGTLKAATLLEIAGAIALLTISVMELAKIDAGGLARASAAITVMFTQLVGSMAIFQKFIGTEGFAKMPFMMLSLILLAGAIDIMVSAVKKLSSLDWEGVHKGVSGLSVMLLSLAASVRLMGNPEQMISTGLGLIALSKGVKILADVVVLLGGLSLHEVEKGLIGVAGLLTSLALFSKFAEANASGAIQGAGIILLAEGIHLLVGSMQDFSAFTMKEIAKSLLLLSGSLAAIGGALKLIPPSSVISAAGVLIVVSSLSLLGEAMKQMGDLTRKEIGKGLIAMAGGLSAIAGALLLIPPSSILSATGVLIVALALEKIVEAINKLGDLSKKEIGKGLIALAGGLVSIAGALALLPPSSVLSAAAIFIVASSLGMINDALAKMGGESSHEIAKALIELGGSLVIIAFAMAGMVDALPGAAALLVVAGALRVLVPVLQAFASMTWTDIAQSLAGLAGVFVILGLAGVGLAPVVPVLVALGGAVLLLGVGMVAAGAGVLLFSLALSALSAAGAVGIATLSAFITAMALLIPFVAKEIGLGVIAFADTIGQAGPAITKAMVAVLGAVLDAIIQLTPKIVDTLGKLLVLLLQKAVEYEPKMLDAGLKLIIQLLDGVAKKLPDVISKATDVVVAFIKGLGDASVRIVQAAFDMVITFVNGLADAIKKNSGPLGDAAGNLANAIIDGLVNGLAHGAGRVASSAKNLAESALSSIGGWLGIHSPSKETYKLGVFTSQGLADGLTATADVVGNASRSVAQTAMDALSQSLAGMSDVVHGNIDITPTITPVLDLSDVKKNASQIGSMLNVKPISVNSSYTTAKIASAGYSANQVQPQQDVAVTKQSAPITYIQNNTSPKALSSAEIYRQTKNQLSATRGYYVLQNGGA